MSDARESALTGPELIEQLTNPGSSEELVLRALMLDAKYEIKRLRAVLQRIADGDTPDIRNGGLVISGSRKAAKEALS